MIHPVTHVNPRSGQGPSTLEALPFVQATATRPTASRRFIRHRQLRLFGLLLRLVRAGECRVGHDPTAYGCLAAHRAPTLASVYPAVWGGGQLVTGTLPDRYGRKWLIGAGMWVQAAAIGLVALDTTFASWALAAVLLGAGTAMVYPTLLAVIGDVAHPAWRARAVGVYRLWRDGGFAVGALLAGILADTFGLLTAIW